MSKYHIWTIGCQMNRAESERLAARFEELGYEAAKNISEAGGRFFFSELKE